ncbi:hypothetical protein [Enterococcus sp. 1001283B150225_161107_E12]|uniref:hypothetical protein n=1 Tax=Enterococcus sp. 1001283B150225_161107_E12 TaxID=2787145 RepID=UPI00189D4A8B|nr:hypothetical protein [Enterococcus sp. 1001283B150225_161107_E12]
MNLIKLGEPIKIGKFLFQYEEMIRHVLIELSFVDVNDPQVKILLKAELRRAENSFYTFYDRNRREPDYAYLQEMVTNFGVNRIQYFQPEMNILSLDNFVNGHIERLKLDKLLTGLVFDSQDLIFVKKYERQRATAYFEANDVYLRGYEQERISINTMSQQIGYRKMKEEFLNDPLIASFRKK